MNSFLVELVVVWWWLVVGVLCHFYPIPFEDQSSSGWLALQFILTEKEMTFAFILLY
jgi:hypothetical protein